MKRKCNACREEYECELDVDHERKRRICPSCRERFWNMLYKTFGEKEIENMIAEMDSVELIPELLN